MLHLCCEREVTLGQSGVPATGCSTAHTTAGVHWPFLPDDPVGACNGSNAMVCRICCYGVNIAEGDIQSSKWVFACPLATNLCRKSSSTSRGLAGATFSDTPWNRMLGST